MRDRQKRTALEAQPGPAAATAVDQQARPAEGLSDEELRFRRTERHLLEVLHALHVNLRAPEAGFPEWDEEVAEFVLNELKGDEDAVEEARRRVEWHRKRVAELHAGD